MFLNNVWLTISGRKDFFVLFHFIYLSILGFDHSNFSRQVKYCRLRILKEILKLILTRWLVINCKNTRTKITISEAYFCTKIKNFPKEISCFPIYIYIYICNEFNKFPNFFVQAFKIENSVCYCYTSDEMTDQFLWFQVQMNSYNSNWNTPN